MATYGNGDGKDASHKGGKIVGFEDQSKNRGRREKSRLKKENTIGRNKMAKKKVKETSKKSKVAQIKLFDLLPEEEKNKINQIMDEIDITDERVMSKFSPIIKEYEKSLEFYSQAAKVNNSIENHMIFKKAIVYYQKEEFKESKKLIEEILEIEDLQYDVKNQCEKYLFILNNSI